MDLASLIGLIGAVGMIVAAMIAGGWCRPFYRYTVNPHCIWGYVFRGYVLKPFAGFLR